MSNFLIECDTILRQAELIANNPITDGTLHRCGTIDKPNGQDGAYIIHLNEPYSMWYKNWRTDEENTYTAKQDGSMTTEERRIYNERIQAEREQREADKAKRYGEASTKAQDIWNGAQTANDTHPYLQKKGVSNFGLRQTHDKKLIVSIMDTENKIQSLQFIQENGTKRFLPGGKTQGGFFHISAKDKRTNGTLCIVEGYATGASVHMATGHAVLVAFNAGNLKHIALIARDLYPQREIILCADNDHNTDNEENIGIEKATEAATASQAKLAVCPLVNGEKADFNDLHQTQGLAAVKAVIEGATVPSAEAQESWEEPIPLNVVEIPPLDIAFLPPLAEQYCEALGEELQVPIELVVAVFLSAISTAVQGKFQVQAKKGHVEQLCTYWTVISPPSERKTPIIKRLKAPLLQWEKNKSISMREEIIRRNTEIEAIHSILDKKRKDIQKGNIPMEEIINEITALELKMPKRIYAPKLFLDDVTSEGLVNILSQNNNTSIIEAEGKIIDILGGQYSSGVPNFDVFLKGYNAEQIRVDRKHSTPVTVENPCITLCLAIQPYVIKNRKAGGAFKGKGLDSRINFLFPKSKVGSRDIEPKTVEEHLENEYANLLCRLLDIQQNIDKDGNSCHYTIELSEDAYGIYLQFSKHVEESLAPNGSFFDMQDWQGKAVGRALRIAGLLHCIIEEEPHSTPISEQNMKNACYFVEILGTHAKAVYGFIDEPENVSCAKRVLTWIKGHKQSIFASRDCKQRLRGSFTKEQVTEALKFLEDNFYLRQKTSPPKKRGRPSLPQYMVNPCLQVDGVA